MTILYPLNHPPNPRSIRRANRANRRALPERRRRRRRPPTEPMPVTDPNAPNLDADADADVDAPWYENRAAVAAIIAVGLLLIFLLVGWLFWWGDDDDDVDESIGTAVIVDSSTLPGASTIPDGSIVDGSTVSTIEVTLPPPTTAPPTTAPATTAPATTAPATPAPATTTPATTAPPAGGESLVDILSTDPDLSIVWQLVQDAGLADVLATSQNENTIFAPNNAAFDGVTPPTGPDLTSLILLHVVPLSLDSEAVFAETSLPTLAGPSLAVDAAAGTVGGATVVGPDLEGDGGTGRVHPRGRRPPHRELRHSDSPSRRSIPGRRHAVRGIRCRPGGRARSTNGTPTSTPVSPTPGRLMSSTSTTSPPRAVSAPRRRSAAIDQLSS